MTNPRGRTPASLGFSMPAEWETHAATWLAWPHNPTDWPDKLDTIRWVYGEIVRKIAPGETVRMLVGSTAEAKLARRYLARAGADARSVEFIVHPTNRGWTRDSGPLFVRRCRVGQALSPAMAAEIGPVPARGASRQACGVGCRANFQRPGRLSALWFRATHPERPARPPSCISTSTRGPSIAIGGKTAEFPKPRPGSSRSASSTRSRAERPFILEGGGIDVNGRGTLITTAECYLEPSSRFATPAFAASSRRLREYFGVTNVFWLGGGVAGDDTHGHVDDICRFVNATTVVLIKEENRATSTTARSGELGAHPGFAPRGRREARGGALAHARTALLRWRPAAGELREFLHLQRGGYRPDVQRPERPRTRWASSASFSRTAR